jgi:hypothetical protein
VGQTPDCPSGAPPPNTSVNRAKTRSSEIWSRCRFTPAARKSVTSSAQFRALPLGAHSPGTPPPHTIVTGSDSARGRALNPVFGDSRSHSQRSAMSGSTPIRAARARTPPRSRQGKRHGESDKGARTIGVRPNSIPSRPADGLRCQRAKRHDRVGEPGRRESTGRSARCTTIRPHPPDAARHAAMQAGFATQAWSIEEIIGWPDRFVD